MRNNRTKRFPYIVAIVQSAQDISKAIMFARNHIMKISVMSSGHDYIGRSTAGMSLHDMSFGFKSGICLLIAPDPVHCFLLLSDKRLQDEGESNQFEFDKKSNRGDNSRSREHVDRNL